MFNFINKKKHVTQNFISLTIQHIHIISKLKETKFISNLDILSPVVSLTSSLRGQLVKCFTTL